MWASISRCGVRFIVLGVLVGTGLATFAQRKLNVDGGHSAAARARSDEIAARNQLLEYIQSGKLDEAITRGRDFVGRWPTDAELHHLLGVTYFKTRQNALAIEQLQKAGRLDASSPDIPFDQALVFLDQKQYVPAALELEKSIKLYPSNALAHVLLGRAYQNSNRSLRAIEEFKTALRLNPDLPLGHFHLGFAYSSVGLRRQAISEYKKEIERSSNNPGVLYQLGHELVESGDLKSGMGYLEKAIEIQPQYGDALYDLGKAKLLAGDVAAAITFLQRSAAVNPADPAPHYQLARAFDNLGQSEDARKERQRFAELKKAQPQSGGMASGQSQ